MLLDITAWLGEYRLLMPLRNGEKRNFGRVFQPPPSFFRIINQGHYEVIAASRDFSAYKNKPHKPLKQTCLH